MFYTITDGNNCSAIDTQITQVDTIPVIGPLIGGNDTIFCLGTTVALQASGGGQYLWSPGTGLNSTTIDTPSAVISDTITYTVTVSNSFGCQDVDSITFYPYPSYELVDSSLYKCIGDTFRLETTGGDSFTWVPPMPGNSAFFKDTLRQDITVSVSIETSDGCIFVDSAIVNADSHCCMVTGADSVLSHTYLKDLMPFLNASGRPLTLHVLDTFYVDTSVTLTNIHLAMDKNSRIEILTGNSIIFDSCHFYSSCGIEMWDGIYLDDDFSSLTLSNGTFQDAKNGVVSENGAGVTSNKMEFDLNYIAFQFRDGNGTYPFTMTKTTVQCSDSSLMLPPYRNVRSRYGVKAHNVEILPVGVPIKNYGNTFHNLQIGVYGYRSGFKIRNNTFTSFLPPSSPTFDTIGVGIFATGQAGNPMTTYRTVEVGGMGTYEPNTFGNGHIAIWAHHNLNATVSNNEFEDIDLLGVRLTDLKNGHLKVLDNQMTDTRFGIHSALNLNAQVILKRNVYEQQGQFRGTGIRVDGFAYKLKSDSAKYVIEDNDIKVFGNGILVNALYAPKVHDNKVSLNGVIQGSSAYGIRAKGCDSISIQGNTLIDTTGVSAVYLIDTGNGQGQDSFAFERGIWVGNTPGAMVACNTVTGYGWSIVLEGQQPYSDLWKNDMSDGVDGLVMWGVQTFPGLDKIGDQGRPQDNRWLGGFSRYETNCLSTRGDRVDFYTQGQGNYQPSPNGFGDNGSGILGDSLSPLTTRGGPIACPGTLSPNSAYLIEQMIALDDYPYSIDSIKENNLLNQYLYVRLKTDSTLLASDTLFQNKYDSLTTTNIGTLYEASEEVQANDLTGALSDLENLQTTISVEANEKDVGVLYLETIALQSDTLTSSNLQNLESIAGLCPQTEGYGVYQARSILAYLNPERFWEDSCIATPSSKVRIKSKPNELGSFGEFPIKMYPNPADNFVVFDGLPESEGVIEIRNLVGQSVLRTTFEGNSTSLKMDLGEITAGPYFVRITTLGRVVLSEKLIIAR